MWCHKPANRFIIGPVSLGTITSTVECNSCRLLDPDLQIPFSSGRPSQQQKPPAFVCNFILAFSNDLTWCLQSLYAFKYSPSQFHLSAVVVFAVHSSYTAMTLGKCDGKAKPTTRKIIFLTNYHSANSATFH